MKHLSDISLIFLEQNMVLIIDGICRVIENPAY